MIASHLHRIGIDIRNVGGKISGVSRVSMCLIRALSKIDTRNEYILYSDEPNPDLCLPNNYRIVATHCPAKNLIKDYVFSRIISNDRLDLFHSVHSLLPLFLPQTTKVVVTMHDLFAMTDKLFFIKYKPLHGLVQKLFKYRISRTVGIANRIITVSNYCMNEIISQFPAAKNKVHVIYNAAGLDSAIIKEQVHCDREYILYVGNCRSYKNVEILINAFARLLETNAYRNHKLYIVSNDTALHIRQIIKELAITNSVRFFINPSDGELAELYSKAKLFVFPSKQEGFGMPILEAMLFGVPVIISNADALVEVGGDACVVFDRTSSTGLHAAIQRVLSDTELRLSIIAKGHRRVNEFSWNNSAKKLHTMYREICENN